VASPQSSPLLGRSQGAIIFWGLVSVFFAAAACFYFWENRKNEANADKYREEVAMLQEDHDALKAEKDKLQASISDSDSQLKAREDALQDKETKLADEEARLDALAQKAPASGSSSAASPNSSATAAIKKFGDTARKIDQGQDTSVITRSGRPVLRVANSLLFAPGDATLKSDGKALLMQIAQSLNGQADSVELRVACYSDTDGELPKVSPDASSTGPKKDDAAKTATDAKPRYATCWDLTAARATAIALFYREQSSLPFANVLIVGRGDSDPVAPNAKDGHARNRRVEITVAPLPTGTPTTDPAHVISSAVNPLTPPPDPPPAAKAQ